MAALLICGGTQAAQSAMTEPVAGVEKLSPHGVQVALPGGFVEGALRTRLESADVRQTRVGGCAVARSSAGLAEVAQARPGGATRGRAVRAVPHVGRRVLRARVAVAGRVAGRVASRVRGGVARRVELSAIGRRGRRGAVGGWWSPVDPRRGGVDTRVVVRDGRRDLTAEEETHPERATQHRPNPCSRHLVKVHDSRRRCRDSASRGVLTPDGP